MLTQIRFLCFLLNMTKPRILFQLDSDNLIFLNWSVQRMGTLLQYFDLCIVHLYAIVYIVTSSSLTILFRGVAFIINVVITKKTSFKVIF